MKKIFSFVIVAAAVAMVSCGGNSNKGAAEAEVIEATEVVAVEACDSAACDSSCAEKCDSAASEKAGGCCNE